MHMSGESLLIILLVGIVAGWLAGASLVPTNGAPAAADWFPNTLKN